VGSAVDLAAAGDADAADAVGVGDVAVAADAEGVGAAEDAEDAEGSVAEAFVGWLRTAKSRRKSSRSRTRCRPCVRRQYCSKRSRMV
jgi:hypothetical protein